MVSGGFDPTSKYKDVVWKSPLAKGEQARMHQKPLSAQSKTDGRKPPEFVVRAADIDDLSDFLELALVAGAGFTSLPVDEDLLAERLHRSKPAFLGESGTLMLALEDLDAGRVIGCAAIKAGNGRRSDFLNFLVDDDRQWLEPTSLYSDLTEVGSLLVHPDYRQFGVGRWLAQCRYLAIAGNLPRFGHHLFSELRGVIDDDNRSPFYDGVLAPYFKLTYQEADTLSALGRQAELNAMLPSSPIRVDAIGTAATAALGRPHQDGVKAFWFLEDEGFRFEGAVDLLDGGPLVRAPCRSIKTIQSSFMSRIMPGDVDPDEAQPIILAAGNGADFRSVKGWAVNPGNAVIGHPDLMKRARIDPGGVARAYIDREKRHIQGSATAEAEASKS